MLQGNTAGISQMSFTSRKNYFKKLERFIYVTRKFEVASMEKETDKKGCNLFILVKQKDFLF